MLPMVLHEGTDSQRIDVLFDVYRDSLIKNAEREKGGSESGHDYRNIKLREPTRYINGENPVLTISHS